MKKTVIFSIILFAFNQSFASGLYQYECKLPETIKELKKLSTDKSLQDSVERQLTKTVITYSDGDVEGIYMNKLNISEGKILDVSDWGATVDLPIKGDKVTCKSLGPAFK